MRGLGKWFILGTAVIVGFCVWFFVANSRANNNASFISLSVAPSSSSAKLDNKGVKSGKINVKPGKHTIIVSKKGFSTQINTVDLKTKETKYVGIALLPNSPETKNWYKEHPDDQLLLESISSNSFDQYTKNAVEKNPLIKDLPLIDRFYRVDYGQSLQHPDDPSAMGIYIKYYSQDGKQQALDWIKFKGYDPSQLEIIFQDVSKD